MPGFRTAKNRLIVLLDGNASDDLSLKLLLVYSKNLQALKNFSKSSLPVLWKPNKKACVTLLISEDYFFHHLILELRS